MRVSWPDNERSITQVAYTIDVSQRGARLAGIRGVNDAGRLIAIRRKTSEAQFKVVWVGKPPSPQQGQMGVECVEDGKIIWDVDFKKVCEDFEPIGTPEFGVNPSRLFGAVGTPACYDCNGLAKMWHDESSGAFEARLLGIGFGQCQLEPAPDVPRGPILLELHFDEIELTVKGKVCKRPPGPGTWIEFTHIRRGDHHLLQAVLNRLADRKWSSSS